MVCTRGTPKNSGSRDPRDCNNYFYAWCVPYVHVITPEVALRGASALIANSVTRIPDKSINPLIKNYHWGDFTKGLFEAKDKNYETVILTDQDKNITEGPGFNVFTVTNSILTTSNHGVLNGITRQTVIEIARKLKIRIQIRNLPKSELIKADEVFISTSGGGIILITQVNNRVYANGICAPLTLKIHEVYWDWIKNSNYRTEINYLD